MKPSFEIIANENNITGLIADRLVSIRVIDEVSDTSDSIELKLDDNDSKFELPNTDVQLTVKLGYENKLVPVGVFSGLEVEVSVAPDSILIRGSAMNLRDGIKAKKTRSFDIVTIGDLAKRIASDNGYEALVADSIVDELLLYVAQTNESDWQLLIRIANKYDAFVKASGGKILIAKRSEKRGLLSNQSLPIIELKKSDVQSCKVKHSDRQRYDAVIAKWYDKNEAKSKQVIIGNGEIVTELPDIYDNERQAAIAADTVLKNLKRKLEKVSLKLAGRSDISAMCELKLKGFREGINGSYTITRVEHELSPAGGYLCTIEAEV